MASMKEQSSRVSETASRGPNQAPARRADLRVSPNAYAIALLPAIFLVLFFHYLGLERLAIGLAVVAAALPLLAFFDRAVVEGFSLRRSGIVPRLWSVLRRRSVGLAFSDIEQVETQALRAIKRGGNVYYRYRTTITGNGLRFVLVSGGRRYREVVGQILTRVPSSALDSRSLELRDHLADPLDVLMKADIARIPGPDVLEDTLFGAEGKIFSARADRSGDSILNVDDEKAAYLRKLANELRVSGYLLQAVEAFRRAIAMRPEDGWLLFESARCLHALGSSNRDARMQKRARALLRLSEMRANGDRELLSRVGECYFQFGEWERAKNAFQNAADTLEENFRALRGLAELALREGKLAHTVLHFRAAARVAETGALRRWTQSEAEYFSMLNTDEAYLRKEIRRINLLDDLRQAKNKAFRIGFIGVPPIFVGKYFNDAMVTEIGWAVSATGFLFWVGINVAISAFGERRASAVTGDK